MDPTLPKSKSEDLEGKMSKSGVFSMAAERMASEEHEQVTSKLEAVKFSTDSELDYTSSSVPFVNRARAESESSEDFFDAEDETNGVSSNGVNHSDIEEESDCDVGLEEIMMPSRTIVLHILSQIRIGMDITRFTLPACILEPRSTLQLYGDMLARPHLLLRITDEYSPKERMIAIAQWFLSCISASRKGTSPKKPYNPVLGETYRCYRELPDGNKAPPDQRGKAVLETGPFPQAGYNSFSYVAEQVSHHPPVTAFYAECPSMQIYVNATIETKTKFTGLAVKVQNTGSFQIHLLEHDEVYETCMPKAYVRGLLGTPWFEFGGECSLECAKSGHVANIEFLTKPFRGGKKNSVTAQLRHKSDKDPYMCVEGEWDSVLYAKFPNGHEEVFFDASTATIVKKKWKKLPAAEPTDSRVVWQHVTDAILREDEQGAADAKHEVEEKQRADVRERQQSGEEFQQKLFHQSEDDPALWEYNSPLDKRQASFR